MSSLSPTDISDLIGVAAFVATLAILGVVIPLCMMIYGKNERRYLETKVRLGLQATKYRGDTDDPHSW